mmetsp:Transcript_12091/g.23338  ORF Transcript_12091/g.23338 Transcript_12091/m.23338 type:complete len:108 (+) Transcript_12091:924-1247(+)
MTQSWSWKGKREQKHVEKDGGGMRAFLLSFCLFQRKDIFRLSVSFLECACAYVPVCLWLSVCFHTHSLSLAGRSTEPVRRFERSSIRRQKERNIRTVRSSLLERVNE